jgi:hypothetical protein
MPTGYQMAGHPLEKVSRHDYLGVTINDRLTWTDHIDKIAKKSSSKLALLKRTLSSCKRDVKETAYKSLIRPKLEYACSAWNPYNSSEINKLEHVQRQAARFVHADYRRSSSPTDLIRRLQWDSLQVRRLLIQSTMFYKIVTNYVLIPLPPNIVLNKGPSRHTHHLTYQIPRSNLELHQYSFYPRIVRVWNLLPVDAVTATSPQAFQRAALPIIRHLEPSCTIKVN